MVTFKQIDEAYIAHAHIYKYELIRCALFGHLHVSSFRFFLSLSNSFLFCESFSFFHSVPFAGTFLLHLYRSNLLAQICSHLLARFRSHLNHRPFSTVLNILHSIFVICRWNSDFLSDFIIKCMKFHFVNLWQLHA